MGNETAHRHNCASIKEQPTFAGLVGMVFVNTYLAYNHFIADGDKNALSNEQWREKLAGELLNNPLLQAGKQSARILKSLSTNTTTAKRSNLGHPVLIDSGKRLDCVMCARTDQKGYKRSRVSWMCSRCGVALCYKYSDRNCYELHLEKGVPVRHRRTKEQEQ
eukprot:comp23676_c0_seq1/m.40528 comp23676_c0_seq1/g.40528  ORF comp23676_c0_seq1/g.40528 comp23676_c0_seq1/m.40528 type:complete len:163 (-) comp23676_c0_seq1:19-507(-)